MEKVFRKIPILVLMFMWVYVLGAFVSPVAYSLGNEEVGRGASIFYEQFCHQRVERSAFLFGQDPSLFYSIDELKEFEAIPQVNPYVENQEYPEYFGHGLDGNEEIGWKVSFCIRDIALYLALAVTSTVLYFLKKKVNIPVWVYIILFAPMVVDGVFQSIVTTLEWEAIPIEYVNNIPKRIITGVMFGTGFGLFVYGYLIEAVNELKG
jgi:uncharacterized membrane protein